MKVKKLILYIGIITTLIIILLIANILTNRNDQRQTPETQAETQAETEIESETEMELETETERSVTGEYIFEDDLVLDIEDEMFRTYYGIINNTIIYRDRNKLNDDTLYGIDCDNGEVFEIATYFLSYSVEPIFTEKYVLFQAAIDSIGNEYRLHIYDSETREIYVEEVSELYDDEMSSELVENSIIKGNLIYYVKSNYSDDMPEYTDDLSIGIYNLDTHERTVLATDMPRFFFIDNPNAEDTFYVFTYYQGKNNIEIIKYSIEGQKELLFSTTLDHDYYPNDFFVHNEKFYARYGEEIFSLAEEGEKKVELIDSSYGSYSAYTFGKDVYYIPPIRLDQSRDIVKIDEFGELSVIDKSLVTELFNTYYLTQSGYVGYLDEIGKSTILNIYTEFAYRYYGQDGVEFLQKFDIENIDAVELGKSIRGKVIGISQGYIYYTVDEYAIERTVYFDDINILMRMPLDSLDLDNLDADADEVVEKETKSNASEPETNTVSKGDLPTDVDYLLNTPLSTINYDNRGPSSTYDGNNLYYFEEYEEYSIMVNIYNETGYVDAVAGFVGYFLDSLESSGEEIPLSVLEQKYGTFTIEYSDMYGCYTASCDYNGYGIAVEYIEDPDNPVVSYITVYNNK